MLRQLFELDQPGENRLHSMEGLRGIAVSLVFLVHYTTLVEPWLPAQSAVMALAHALRAMGNTGVDLFFVLSGYLIYGHLIARQRRFASYFARRVKRIYPTFLAVFAIYLALAVALPSADKLPPGRGAAALYVVENLLLLPGLFPIDPLITVAWSLSLEMAFYLATPLLIVALRLHAWPRGYRAALLLAMALAAGSWYSLGGPGFRWIMFLSGAILAETAPALGGRAAERLALPVFIISLVATWILREGVAGTGPLRVWILFVGFYVVCLGCFTGQGLATRIASWLPLRLFGNISYSYYLIHGLVVTVAFRLLSEIYPPRGDDVVLFWWFLAPTFVASILVGAALFLIVERPLSFAPRAPRALPTAAPVS